MTPQEFIAKWQSVQLSERSACQQHFLDLCELLGQPKPAAADPEGTWYTFERGVHKTEGGSGLGGCLAERQVRLGIQRQAQRPRRGLLATAAISRGFGKPAAVGRLRSGPLQNPHQLHPQRQTGSTNSRSID